MWSKLMEVKNGYAAEVWKELFNTRACRTASSRQLRRRAGDGRGECEIWVPWSKTHVAEEIVRKS